MSARLFKVLAATVSACRALLRKDLPRYRPEAHYMRGPGPKWLAKQAEVSGRR
jgi:hypothetical protein